MSDNEKQIKVLEVRVGDIKDTFGNPRKINRIKRDELKRSLETFGNFGLILLDEDMNCIAGNQRVKLLTEEDPDQLVLCKQLIGYTESELKAINIKDNTHAGEWDMDLLADWTADLLIDLDLDTEKLLDPDEKSLREMEPIRFEKYDYVIIACNNEIDYNELTRNLGLVDKRMKVTEKRTIKARAVWYHEMKAQILPDEE